MERAMVGFHRDDEGDWVAHLDCGHTQHVRHRPPFQMRPWAVEEEGRRSRLGAPLECPLCDRAEMPDGLEFVRSSDTWNDSSAPAGLRRDHRLGAGTWGCLRVTAGRMTFVPGGPGWSIGDSVDLAAGTSQAIPPAMAHHVEFDGAVSFRIDFYRVPAPAAEETRPASGQTGESTGRPVVDEGGEAACLAPLVCDECGALVDRPGAHRPGCSAAGESAL